MNNSIQAQRVCCHLSTRRSARWIGALLIALVFASSYPISLLSQDDPAEGDQNLATYTVQSGETLSEIAVNLGVSMPELMQINGILDSDAIYVGQILRLPLDASLLRENAEDSGAAEPGVGAPVLPGTSHTVKRGETLSEIAQQYGVEMDELMRLNGIAEPDAVLVGQTLALPAGEAETTSVDAFANEPAPASAVTAIAPEIAPEDVLPAVEPTQTPPPTETPSGEAEAIEAGEEIDSLTPLQRITTLNRLYTVRTNDSLGLIALRTGVDLDALRQINGFDEEFVALVIGQELLLPATAQETTVEPVADASGEVYAVEAGDSLSAIASAYGISMAELMAANGVANPDSIRIGQALRIPPPQDEATTDKPPSVGPAQRGFYYYTVGAGDTLSQLAPALDSTVLALLEYNGLPDEETVYRGLELRIPFGPPVLPLRHPRIPQSGTRFVVSLSRQECWVFHGDRILHAWTCSTGYDQYTTRTGTFAVKTRLEMAESSAYELDMPYWLGIYDVGSFENGIHGLPVRWDTGEKLWSNLIGQPATFGCAMLADEEAATLFYLSYLGMPVHVVD